MDVTSTLLSRTSTYRVRAQQSSTLLLTEHKFIRTDLDGCYQDSLHIASLISHTAQRFQGLLQLMQDTGVFTDNSENIGTLTQKIQSDLGAIMGRIEALEKTVPTYAPAGQQQSVLVKESILQGIKKPYLKLAQDFTNALQQHQRQQVHSPRAQHFGRDQDSNGFLPTFQQRVAAQPVTTQSTAWGVTGSGSAAGFPSQSAAAASNATRGPSVGADSDMQQHHQQFGSESNANQLRSRAGPATGASSGPGSGKNAGGGRQSIIPGRAPIRGHKNLSYFMSELTDDGGVDSDMEHGPNFDSLVEGAASQYQQQQEQHAAALQDQNDSYYQSRSNTMNVIKETIEDIANMYTRLTDMIHKQEETALRIDANIEQVSYNVDAAADEIHDYYDTVSSNQWLLIKIFAILVIFGIFFVTVLT